MSSQPDPMSGWLEPVCLHAETEEVDAPSIGATRAAEAWSEVRARAKDGHPERALLALTVAEAAYPRLADRFAVTRGELLLQAKEPVLAEAAFEDGVDSVDSTIRVRAQTGLVRARIAADDPDADGALTRLLREFPELPQELELRFELGQSRARRGLLREAIADYRDIDQRYPGSPVAALARAELDALARAGETIPESTLTQRVDRAVRLVRLGPQHQARTALAALESEIDAMPAGTRSNYYSAAARLARVEGRWEDAHLFAQRARGHTPDDPDEAAEVASRSADLAAAAVAREVELAQREIRGLRGRGPIRSVSNGRLFRIVKTAARVGLVEELNEALEALASRRVYPGMRFEASIFAAGTGDDRHIVKLLDPIVDHGTFGVAARYHRARAYERLGRLTEADTEFARVEEEDRGNRFYAMWSQVRRRAVAELLNGACGPDPQRALPGRECEPDGRLASLEPVLPAQHLEGLDPRVGPDPDEMPKPDLTALANRLSPIAEKHAEAYPWLPRAVDLLRLGDPEGASAELYEAYLSWRVALGRRIAYAGLESVCRGGKRKPERFDWSTKQARRQITSEEREEVADIALAIGDFGTAVGFGGWDRALERPRAYEPVVVRAARRQGLDPNLLLAVMRVESIYQRRVVSYAGAIGLMQIMPRTGRLIADSLGRREFDTADLLDPELNLEFAAWYLRSLIERFDGHLPLAVASYNGGPHNVRRWLRDHSKDMALDAFLERIPFNQTHRYVRRVLTHYAAYRAQQGLPVEHLSVEVPDVGADPVAF